MQLNKVKILLCLFFIQFSLNGQTQTELNEQYKQEYIVADRKMNEVYQEILLVYKEDSLFLKKLKGAQRVWIQFRDLHVESLFPEENKQEHYGSVYPLCYWNEMTTLTKQRTEQLTLWVDGLSEGDVCTGSRRPD